jgi:23S rRNA maturation mini-RNase III
MNAFLRKIVKSFTIKGTYIDSIYEIYVRSFYVLVDAMVWIGNCKRVG